MNAPGSRRLVMLLPLLFALTWVVGCMSYQAVPDAEWSRIQSGDEVRVTMRAGPVHELEVLDRDTNTLRGAEIELKFAEVLQIERYEATFAPGRWLVIAAAVAFVVISLANFDLD